MGIGPNGWKGLMCIFNPNIEIDIIGYTLIREIPDHATFRGKGVNTGLVRQTWGISLFGPM